MRRVGGRKEVGGMCNTFVHDDVRCYECDLDCVRKK